MATAVQARRSNARGMPVSGPRGTRPGPRYLQTLVLVEGIAYLFLIGLHGSPAWRAVRILAVALLTSAGAFGMSRPGPALRGIVALVLGIAGTVAGAGIGGVYMAEVGMSIVTVASMTAVLAGLWLLVWGFASLTRAIAGWRRLAAAPAALALLVFVLYPLTLAVNATNRPATAIGATTPADRGLPYRNVAFTTSDGVRLSAWYISSATGAAAVLLPGAGSTRSAVLDHAVVLARHGFGVLLLDTRGHGRSQGDAMDLGWAGDRDIAAAVSFLAERPDVRDGRVAAVGMSMGGEQAIAAGGSDARIRAVVAEGATGMQLADHGWLSHYGVRGSITKGIEWVTYTAAGLLSGAPRPMPLRDAVAATAPRPVMLIAAGTVADESLAATFLRDASPRTVQVWVVPGAGHTGGLASRPAEWEARVTSFLEAALAR